MVGGLEGWVDVCVGGLKGGVGEGAGMSFLGLKANAVELRGAIQFNLNDTRPTAYHCIHFWSPCYL